jgi:hypothetical protein
VLELVPKSWFSWNFDVLENGRLVAHLNNSAWAERGTISIDGSDYLVYRENPVSGYFILEKEGSLIARAKKPSAFRESFNIEYSGKSYTLRKESFMGRAFVLCEDDQKTGSLQTMGLFTRKATASLPEGMPMPIRVFIIWLTILLWKRESDSTAAVTTITT